MQGIPLLSNCIIDNFQRPTDSSPLHSADCYYFLTHFHCNHYKGLHPQWKEGRIFCSKHTAKLLINLLKFQAVDLLCPVEYNETVDLGNMKVTFLDANHCIGSIMMLFQTQPSGGSQRGHSYLYTGDMKYSPTMKLYPVLQTTAIDNIFVDTTYAHPKHSYYNMKLAYQKILTSIQTFFSANPHNGLILFTGLILGKEDILFELWNQLPEAEATIYLDPERFLLFSQLAEITATHRLLMTTERLQSRIHVYSKTLIRSSAQQLYPQYGAIEELVKEINSEISDRKGKEGSSARKIQEPIEKVLVLYASGWAENMHLQSYYTSMVSSPPKKTSMEDNKNCDMQIPESEPHTPMMTMSTNPPGAVMSQHHMNSSAASSTPMTSSSSKYSANHVVEHVNFPSIRVEIFPHVTHSTLAELQELIGWLQPTTITPLFYHNEAEKVYFNFLLQKCIRSSPSNKIRTFLTSNATAANSGTPTYIKGSPTIAAAIMKSNSGTYRSANTPSTGGNSGKFNKTPTQSKVRFDTNVNASNIPTGNGFFLPPPIVIGESNYSHFQEEPEKKDHHNTNGTELYLQENENRLSWLRPAPLLIITDEQKHQPQSEVYSSEITESHLQGSSLSQGQSHLNSSTPTLPFAKISLHSPKESEKTTNEQPLVDQKNFLATLPNFCIQPSSDHTSSYSSLKTPRHRRPNGTTNHSIPTALGQSHSLVQIPEEEGESDESSSKFSKNSMEISNENSLPSQSTDVPHLPPQGFSSVLLSPLPSSSSFDHVHFPNTTRVTSYSDTKGKILKQLRISELEIPTQSNGTAKVHRSITPIAPITPISINSVPGVQHCSSNIQETSRLMPPPWLSIPPIITNTLSSSYDLDAAAFRKNSIERSYSEDIVPNDASYRRKVRGASVATPTTPNTISYPTAEDLDEYWSCQYCTFSHYGKASALLQQCSVCHTPRNALHNTNTLHSPFFNSSSSSASNTPSSSSAHHPYQQPDAMIFTPSFSTNANASAFTGCNDSSLPLMSCATISCDLPQSITTERDNMRSLTVENISNSHDIELFSTEPSQLLHEPYRSKLNFVTAMPGLQQQDWSGHAQNNMNISSSSSNSLLSVGHCTQSMYDDALRTFSAEF